MRIFCVIPAYNEAENIARTVKEVRQYVDEVVVVDDCSGDQTVPEVEKLGSLPSPTNTSANITLLQHPINRGQGAALQTGNTYALSRGAEIIVHFDADGQFLPREIPEIIDPIRRGEADVCFGSRFLGKRSNLPPVKEKIILPAAGLVNRLFFGIRTSDPQNGFRALSGKTAENIEIEQDEMAHCSEILYKAHKNGSRIKEVPVTVIYHEFGQRFGGGIKIIKDMIIKGFLVK